VKMYLKTLFIFMVIFSLSVAWIKAEESDEDFSEEPAKEPHKGTKLAADFGLHDLEKNIFTLSSYRNKQPVILFFWTTWCPFCREELKNLNDKYPELKKEGWEVLTIDVGEPAYKVDNFVKNRALIFKVLLDKETIVAQAYEILGVPTYVLINKKGYVVFRNNYLPRNFRQLISE